MTLTAPHHYRLRTIGILPVPMARMFGAGVDLAGHPECCPDVRAASRLNEHTADLVYRSREGLLGGVVRAHPAGSELEITQPVVVRKRGPRTRMGASGDCGHVWRTKNRWARSARRQLCGYTRSCLGGSTRIDRPPQVSDITVRSHRGDEVRRNAGFDHLALPWNRLFPRFRIQGGCNYDGS